MRVVDRNRFAGYCETFRIIRSSGIFRITIGFATLGGLLAVVSALIMLVGIIQDR